MSNIIFINACILVVISFVLGGSTDLGALGTTIIELYSLQLLVFIVFIKSNVGNLSSKNSANRRYYFFWFCPVLFSLLQILPLPASMWTSLPGRSTLSDVYDLMSTTKPWYSISLLPRATRLTAFELLPTAAIFMATLQMNLVRRQTLVGLCLLLGITSCLLGLAQTVQGDASPLRFYEFSSVNHPVGFFANSNHFSALLYSSMVLNLFAITSLWPQRSKSDKSHKAAETNFVLLAFAIASSFMLFATQILTTSRMGNALMIVGLIASFVAFLVSKKTATGNAAIWSITFVGLVLMGIAASFGLDKFSARIGQDLHNEARLLFTATTFKAALGYLPFGSGLGSFERVYALQETSQTVLSTVVNHAHNDYVEVFLEAGAFGVLWIGLFVIWWMRQTARIWRISQSSTAFVTSREAQLARTASIIVALLLIHSLVDYPLRTETLSIVFAMSCALMLPDRQNKDAVVHDAPSRSRRKKVALMPIGMAGDQHSKTRNNGNIASDSMPAKTEWPDAWSDK